MLMLLCAPFQYSLCNEALIELTNPGASGSIFYVTRDDEFIIKTVQHKEAEFLQKLLPGYYMVSPSQNTQLSKVRKNKRTAVALLNSAKLHLVS